MEMVIQPAAGVAVFWRFVGDMFGIEPVAHPGRAAGALHSARASVGAVPWCWRGLGRPVSCMLLSCMPCGAVMREGGGIVATSSSWAAWSCWSCWG